MPSIIISHNSFIISSGRFSILTSTLGSFSRFEFITILGVSCFIVFDLFSDFRIIRLPVRAVFCFDLIFIGRELLFLLKLSEGFLKDVRVPE
jgi:hypothetical protein